jgi:hypothetical protein
MTIGLFSRCLGCSSTFAAMTQFPGAFDGVHCLVGPQPVTMKTIVQRRLALLGVPADHIGDLEQRIVLLTSTAFVRRAPQEWARNVRMPAFLYQVHDDVLTEPGPPPQALPPERRGQQKPSRTAVRFASAGRRTTIRTTPP